MRSMISIMLKDDDDGVTDVLEMRKDSGSFLEILGFVGTVGCSSLMYVWTG